MAYRWNFAPLLDNADVLWVGAQGTLRLFAICAVAGLSGGLLIGLAVVAWLALDLFASVLLPFVFMVAILIWKPAGFAGSRT